MNWIRFGKLSAKFGELNQIVRCQTNKKRIRLNIVSHTRVHLNTSISIEIIFNWNLLRVFNSVGNDNVRTKEFLHVNMCVQMYIGRYLFVNQLTSSQSPFAIHQFRKWFTRNFSKKNQLKLKFRYTAKNLFWFFFSHNSIAIKQMNCV